MRLFEEPPKAIAHRFAVGIAAYLNFEPTGAWGPSVNI